MKKNRAECALSDEDLQTALREMKTYVDVTEDDLRKIYEIALRHARERAALRVPVGGIMTTKVVATSPDADLHEAARLLSVNRISGMPVLDEQNRVVGVISEADLLTLAGMQKGHTFRDILHRILREPVPSRKSGETVRDVMSAPPITASAEDDASEVANILNERRIKRLPVVDDEGKVVGVISRADIVRAIGEKSV